MKPPTGHRKSAANGKMAAPSVFLLHQAFHFSSQRRLRNIKRCLFVVVCDIGVSASFQQKHRNRRMVKESRKMKHGL